MVPEADAAETEGNLIQRLSQLWEEATTEERQKLLWTILDGVYVNARGERVIVVLKFKPADPALFRVAARKQPAVWSYTIKESPPQKRAPTVRVLGGYRGGSNYTVLHI